MTTLETPPKLGLEKDVRMWMEKNLDGTIHPALNTDVAGIAFDEGEGIYVVEAEETKGKETSLDLKMIYQEAENRKQHFIQVVNEYTLVAKKKTNYLPEVKITENHTLEEVTEKLKEAIQKYDEDAVKGFRGQFHKNARSFGDNSDAFKSYLELLPTESHYLSVVCGGMKLILRAVSRISDIGLESIRL